MDCGCGGGGGGGGSLSPPWYMRWWSLRAYLFLNILAHREHLTAGLLKCTRSMCFQRLRRHEMSFPHSWHECGRDDGGNGGDVGCRSSILASSNRPRPITASPPPRRSSGGGWRGSGRVSYCWRASSPPPVSSPVIQNPYQSTPGPNIILHTHNIAYITHPYYFTPSIWQITDNINNNPENCTQHTTAIP